MKSLIPYLLILLLSCSGYTINNTFERSSVGDDPQSVILGLDVLFDEKINLIKNKNIALVINQSGVDKEGRSTCSVQRTLLLCSPFASLKRKLKRMLIPKL